MSATAMRTGHRIDELRAAGRATLIGYLPVGFPTLDRSVEAARALVDCGVDIIELGIPYTDPVLDGPTIQRAAEAALAGGVHVADVFEAVQKVAATGVRVLVMTYYNPVLRYGVDSFARDLDAAGGAGLITADLIPDEAGEWIEAATRYDLDRVFLVAPSSTDERLVLTASATRGFVYAASTMGVTGARTQVGGRAAELVARTRAAGAERVCVGLGVSTGAQAAEVASYADGVIVGSAFVRTMLGDEPWLDQLRALRGVGESIAAGVRSADRPVVTVPGQVAGGVPAGEA